MSCYSVRQIEQIENGESSSFYGAQVKFTAAKKVAGLLKLSEENAFDFGESAPVKKTETLKNESPEAQGQSAASSSVSQTTPEQESVPVKSAPEKSIPKQKSLKLEVLSSASVKASQPTEKDCFVVSDCSSVGIFNCESASTLFPEPVKEEIVVVEEVVPASPPADASADSKGAPAAPEPAVAAVPAVAAASVSTECPPAAQI